MFETAELGQEVSAEEYAKRVPALRESLVAAQSRLLEADFPVIVILAGVDGAGKGETSGLLNEWLDPRWIYNRAFDDPTQDELERPEYWRFWRDLPRHGHIGIFLSTWYSRPLLERVVGKGSDDQLEAQIDEILAFERTLADDGALFQKFWLHLGKDAQDKRFRELESDPLQSWRVTERDWQHWNLYDQFIAASERIISRTSTGDAPWHIVEGWNPRHRGLRVAEPLLEAIERRLAKWEKRSETKAKKKPAARASAKAAENGKQKNDGQEVAFERPATVLSKLDLSQKLTKARYRELLELHQGRLNRLQRLARGEGTSAMMVFEGWDAAGKGGAIRRINGALDSRSVRVHQIAAPSDEELAHHYLWRFWTRIPRAGYTTIFDRSWYGRVLVERVEGFAGEAQWRRAYAEINAFEEQLVAEDWRNRERWCDYESAVHDMVERTSTRMAPWVLVEGNDKRHARVRILETICDKLEERFA
jgi:polyphosphate:AMP phosphotransferase